MKKSTNRLVGGKELASLGDRFTQFVSGLGLPFVGGFTPLACSNSECGRVLQARVAYCPYCGANQVELLDSDVTESSDIPAVGSDKVEDTNGIQWLKRVWPFSPKKP